MAKKGVKNNKQAKRKENRAKEEAALQKLEQLIEEYDPKTQKPSQFQELPISQNLIQGLKEASYSLLTDIQREAIPYALKGNDILGAAKTGSGKTLAFLIPVIEKLNRAKWTDFDGLGALIISPTRELAMQIYEVLLKIGKHFQLSVGLVIGGKDVKFEMERIQKINILIGTPGRILQHMDQSLGFDVSNLQMLVLDEADRILDLGFKKTLDNIVANLPPERQTLLFSATQSKSVSDLARLSLTNPQYIGVKQAEDETATPDSLSQSYITVKLEDKLDTLYSFIKTHLKTKIIVFLSTSKQVHFVYETFRKLQPGMSLMKLHGRQKQTARTETVYKFTKAQHVCLFATDVVARGLDFPTVDWVVQVDAPEDADTYVHRVGRSARAGKSGKALLMLTPSEEEGFLKRLQSKKIEPKKLNIKQNKKKSIKQQLQALCFKDAELKYLGQKAFISYLRSIIINKDKDVFKIEDVDKEAFAKALGLPSAPQVKIKGESKARELKNVSRQLLALSKANDDGEFKEEDKKVRTKYDRMFERQNQNVLSSHYLKIQNDALKDENDDESDSDGEFMSVKRTDHDLVNEDLPDLTAPTSKRAAKRALSKKASLNDKGNAKKLVFDDEGNAHQIYEFQDEDDFKAAGDAKLQKDDFIGKESEVMQVDDESDKKLAKEKKLEKKRKRKEAERLAKEGYNDDPSERGEDDDYAVDHNLAAKLLEDLDAKSDDNSEDERPTKKPKWFQNDKVGGKTSKDDGVLEIEEPETLEDLEALTARLIQD